MLRETSRRSILGALSAAPVAFAAAALPLPVLAGPGASAASPDADLIRHAAKLADLALQAKRTADRYADLVEECEAIERARMPVDVAMQAKVDAACSLSGRNDARVRRRSQSLALMSPVTPGGLAEKASAYLTVKGAGWAVPVDWLDDLATAIVHDAMRIGERA